MEKEKMMEGALIKFNADLQTMTDAKDKKVNLL